MKTKFETHGTVARIRRGCFAAVTLVALLGAQPSAQATEPQTGSIYDPSQSYPLLPDLPGPDISGEAGVMIYLHDDRAVVELDGGLLYEVGDRPLEIAVDSLTRVTVLFELPDHPNATILLTEDGQWVETFTAELGVFDYVLWPGGLSLGFEITLPGQEAPTIPDVIIKPTDSDPDPA